LKKPLKYLLNRCTYHIFYFSAKPWTNLYRDNIIMQCPLSKFWFRTRCSNKLEHNHTRREFTICLLFHGLYFQWTNSNDFQGLRNVISHKLVFKFYLLCSSVDDNYCVYLFRNDSLHFTYRRWWKEEFTSSMVVF
jgi:hypothetical protein